MKKTLALFATAALCALCALAKDKNDGLLPSNYQKFTKAKRVCVGRDIIEVGGVKKVVTRWNRDGKPDWILPAVETNDLRRLRGVEQFNPLQADAEDIRQLRTLGKKSTKSIEKIVKDIDKAIKKAEDDAEKAYFEKLKAVVNESLESYGK